MNSQKMIRFFLIKKASIILQIFWGQVLFGFGFHFSRNYQRPSILKRLKHNWDRSLYSFQKVMTRFGTRWGKSSNCGLGIQTRIRNAVTRHLIPYEILTVFSDYVSAIGQRESRLEIVAHCLSPISQKSEIIVETADPSRGQRNSNSL